MQRVLALRSVHIALTIVLIRLALSSYWAVTLPTFEAHDETGHFALVDYIARHAALPEPGRQLTEWFDESHQPPLYYLLAAVAARPFLTAEPSTPVVNPFFLRGDRLGGVNAVLHDPTAESFPWTDPQRFIIAGRMVSALLSAAAVFFVFLCIRLLFPTSPLVAPSATAVAAFNPTWVFIGGALTNDSLVALTGTMTLWALLRILLRPSPPSVNASEPKKGSAFVSSPAGNWVDFAWLGLSLGLALLSKNNALVLAPLGIAAITPRLLQIARVSVSAGTRRAAIVVALPALIAGWWYLRNFLALGRPLADRAKATAILQEVSPFFETIGKRSPAEFASGLATNSFRTFWGEFGWGTVAFPDVIYWALLILTVLAGLGLVVSLLKDRAHVPSVALLVGFALVVGALPLYRAIFFNSPTLVPGRYLLPAIVAPSALLAIGLAALPRPFGLTALSATTGGLLLLSASSLNLIVLPQYQQPPRLTAAQVAQIAVPVDYTYGGKAQLIGYRAEVDRVHPGDEMQVTLYWKSLAAFDRPYTLGLHLLDLQSNSVAATNSWPGDGNYPTNLWRPGDIFADPYRLKIPESAPAPFVGLLEPRLHDYSPSLPGTSDFQFRGDLPVLDAHGTPVNPILGTVTVETPTADGPPTSALARFGSAVQLESLAPTATVGSVTLDIDLIWRALTPPRDPLVVFVHVLDATGAMVAQSDSEPRSGLYPTPSWRPGEPVRDRITVALPKPYATGEGLRVAVGLYRRSDLTRITAEDPNGHRLPDDEFILETSTR